jgi:hypothetical protein
LNNERGDFLSPPETFEYGAKVIERIPKCKGGRSIRNRLRIFVQKNQEKLIELTVNNSFRLRKQKNLLSLSFVDIR